jgi:hypothetical protein
MHWLRSERHLSERIALAHAAHVHPASVRLHAAAERVALALDHRRERVGEAAAARLQQRDRTSAGTGRATVQGAVRAC